MKKFLVQVVLTFALASASSAANLLLNSSFEYPTNLGASFADSDWVGTHGGIQNWHPREAVQHGYFEGWTDSYDGQVYQDVQGVSTGTYTFGMWVKLEPGHPSNNLTRMNLIWFDATTNMIQSNTVTYTRIPPDDKYHRVYITATCTSTSLSFVRGMLYSAWGIHNPAGAQAYAFDSAELFRNGDGLLLTEKPIWNESFENPGYQSWGSSQWYFDWMGGAEGGRRENWGGRSGAWLVGLWGWITPPTNFAATLYQNVVPSRLGTNTFRIWIARESAFNVTNSELRIEWFDKSFTNKIAADNVTNITLSLVNDGQWREYYVTGVCTNQDLGEARISAFTQWDYVLSGNAMKYDDARFMEGPYYEYTYTNCVDNSWAYFCVGLGEALTEQVPLANVGPFVQVNYAATTTTFYVLAKYPALAIRSDEIGKVGMRTWYWDSTYSQGVERYASATFVTNVALDSSVNPFHGLPAAGVVTVGLWRYDWTQPKDTNGVLLTVPTEVYVSPYLESYYGDSRCGPGQFMVMRNGELTNNYTVDPQLFSSGFGDKDYLYVNDVPDIKPAFTNGSLENPVTTTNDFAGTGWNAAGNYGREVWAWHSGTKGGYFEGWKSGGGHAVAYQDVAASNGTYTFDVWVKMQPTFTQRLMEVRMEWWATNRLLQWDSTNYNSLPNDDQWYRVNLIAACTNTDVAFIRPTIHGVWGETNGPGYSATMFDDANFQRGSYPDHFVRDWAYHNNPNTALPSAEQVPGGLGLGTFLQINYARTTTTFLILANAPTVNVWPDEVASLFVRTAWEDPAPGPEIWYEQRTPMTWVTNAVLNTGSFHGSPGSGAVTVDVWKVDWTQPTNSSGVPLTEPITVFYSPYVKVTNGLGGEMQFEYLLTNGTPNNYLVNPQLFGTNYKSSDNSYLNQWTATDTNFTDGIPNSWWDFYTIAVGDRVAALDIDGDGDNNLQEYAGNTHPTNGTSFFPKEGASNAPNQMLWYLYVDPSSTGRVYDVYYRTNLIPEDHALWLPLNLSVTGSGGGLQLTVTNLDIRGFYRTGAHLP